MPVIAKIEKGIPVPAHHPSTKFPLAVMEIGDSFFVVGVTIVSLHQGFRRHRPKRFISRTVVEEGVRGVRVWRVE